MKPTIRSIDDEYKTLEDFANDPIPPAHPVERLEEYAMGITLCPDSKRWKGGPGSVVKNAPEEHCHDFKALRSEDIANIRPECIPSLGTEEYYRQQTLKEELSQLKIKFDKTMKK